MLTMEPIAHIQSSFPTKFGVPRQSGLVPELAATVVFTPPYRDPEALRGLEDFSHLWLVWEFSHNPKTEWSPTVRPPRLGGNRRMGVFATRSPFRPNPLGLSSVQLQGISRDPNLGPVLHVLGADLVDGTPIYDIKPYIPYTDSHPDATAGFAAETPGTLDVILSNHLAARLPADQQQPLISVLAQDPRPHYQQDPHRVYGMEYAGFDIRFSVDNETLTVLDIVPL